MADQRMTTIRLPLQIGTSSLWSIARSSVFFPGLLIVVCGAYTLWELRDWDKLGWGLGLAIIAAGGAFIYYAYRHLRLALDERPSDVILDQQGLRIEGGPRHGLSLAWTEIDRSGCSVQREEEERFVLWRVIVDIPLGALAVVTEGASPLVDPTQKTPIDRLYVTTRERGKLLVAEGDTPIEQESLAALMAAIRSPRWYGEAPKQKKKAKPAVITCANCGASAIPSPDEHVRCVFCGTNVPVPEDVRTKVRAALELGRNRRAGLRHLVRLLESQPSASFASAALALAAIPIALAWPAAGYFAARGWALDAAGLQRLMLLTVFPLLLTFGAFLLARGRLTDRFALHAVVVGFGARDPERPGEPYRCRACEAALPPAQGSPVVRCMYCQEESVLGLDLRGDAHEAKEEHASLAAAMRKRTYERWLWTFASLASIALFALAYASVRPTLAATRTLPSRPTPTRPQSTSAPRVKTAEASTDRAPAWAEHEQEDIAAFPDVTRTAVVTSKTGAVPFTAKKCDLRISPARRSSYTCRVELKCGDSVVFGKGTSGYEHCDVVSGAAMSFSDPDPTPKDNDPAFEVDLGTATASLGDTLPSGETYAVSFHLQASK